MFAFWHQIADLSRIIGIRDRLRCPHCDAVGTWKPHGGWIDRAKGDNAGVRRWMCKWCGMTKYKNWRIYSTPSAEHKCWVNNGHPDLEMTDLTPFIKCFPIDPWSG